MAERNMQNITITLTKEEKKALKLAALCMWLAGAGALVCFLHLETAMSTDLLCAAGFTGAGALMFLIHLLENRLEYTVIGSEAQPPEGGVEIE